MAERKQSNKDLSLEVAEDNFRADVSGRDAGELQECGETQECDIEPKETQECAKESQECGEEEITEKDMTFFEDNGGANLTDITHSEVKENVVYEARRPQPCTAQIQPKFGPAEGFNITSHHSVLFTKGHRAAADHIKKSTTSLC